MFALAQRLRGPMRLESIRLTFDRGTLRLDGEVTALRVALRFDERTGFHRAPAYKYATLIQAARERGLAVDDQLWSGFRAVEQTPAPPPLRPYQEQALAAFHRFGRRGIIALPTGSGKTRVACAALAYARVSTLVLVPTRVLLDQWVATLRSQFGDPIGVVGDGMRRIARTTVMTFESGYRCLDRFGDAFGMVIVDAAHHFAGGVRAEALEMCVAPIRLGLTATPPAPCTPGAERLSDLIGPVVFALEIADLAGKDLAPLEIVRIPVTLNAEERKAYNTDMARFTTLRRELL